MDARKFPLAVMGGVAALVAAASAAPGPAPEARPALEGKIAALLQSPGFRALSPGRRAARVSALFLGAPYKPHPLGEGPRGRFDRGPLHDFGAFDCTTFVEETMALSLAPDLASALGLLQRIRYEDGRVDYAARRHFPELDWIPGNARAGFLRDITARVAGRRVAWAEKAISKRRWYARKTQDDLRGLGRLSPQERVRRLAELRAAGSNLPDRKARIPYLPVADWAWAEKRIPSGTIVNLVRADSPGVPTLITHQGLLIRKGETLYLRHASERRGRVVDEPAGPYLESYAHAKRKLLGVNLDGIKRRRP